MSKKNSKEISELTPEVIKEFKQFQCLQECKDKLKKWAATLGLIISICVAGIGIFGIEGYMDRLFARKAAWADDQLTKIMKRAIEAEWIAEKAKSAAQEADKQAKQYKASVSELQDVISQTQEKADTLFQKSVFLDGNIRSIKSYVEKELGSLDSRLKSVNKLLTSLASKSQFIADELEEHKRSITKIQEFSKTASEQFAENSQYNVIVHYNKKTRALSNSVLSKLSSVGFKASGLNIEITQASLRDFRTPRRQVTLLDFEKLDSNKVVCTQETKKKADYICELIKTLPGSGDVRTVVEPDFSIRFGSPIFVGSIDYVSLIEVYLIQKELDN